MARALTASDSGVSQVLVIIVIAVAALGLICALTIPMMVVGGSSMLFSAGSGCAGSAQQASSALQSKASGQARNSIPANYLTLYQKTGQQYGVPWVILAGIGTAESDNGQSNAPGVHSGQNFMGAAGPMQIGIGGGSGNEWGGAAIHSASQKVSGVATDGDGDGTANVYDPADAIAGAAKFLVQAGVQTNVPGAIFSYNHAQSYVQEVEGFAATYAAGGFSVTAATGGTANTEASCVQTAGTVIGGTTAVPNQNVASAISFAEQQIGKPYLWGGTGPDSYDCSGLTVMAYQTAGVSIPRTSEAQWAWGPQIQAGHEVPGDLVFFAGSDGTPTSPGHVGLVIGGGKMIEAYATGTNIRIATYGQASSPPGDQTVVGFTRPWAHAGVVLNPAQAAG